MNPVKYDPDHVEPTQPMIGYKGRFPTTPCRNCGHEYFVWIGDWGLGYMCAECRRKWQPHTE